MTVHHITGPDGQALVIVPSEAYEVEVSTPLGRILEMPGTEPCANQLIAQAGDLVVLFMGNFTTGESANPAWVSLYGPDAYVVPAPMWNRLQDLIRAARDSSCSGGTSAVWEGETASRKNVPPVPLVPPSGTGWKVALGVLGVITVGLVSWSLWKE